MFQVYWQNMPPLNQVAAILHPWGEGALLRPETLRHIPADAQYPAFYFNANGVIDILAPESDLFYRADCLEALEMWIGQQVRVLGEEG